jgi:hypothetical protein
MRNAYRHSKTRRVLPRRHKRHLQQNQVIRARIGFPNSTKRRPSILIHSNTYPSLGISFRGLGGIRVNSARLTPYFWVGRKVWFLLLVFAPGDHKRPSSGPVRHTHTFHRVKYCHLTVQPSSAPRINSFSWVIHRCLISCARHIAFTPHTAPVEDGRFICSTRNSAIH